MLSHSEHEVDRVLFRGAHVEQCGRLVDGSREGIWTEQTGVLASLAHRVGDPLAAGLLGTLQLV